MSIAIVTFDIIEYLPSDFKYDNFSFIISSESRDFEQEISYLNKNQITHKANLKRELKYSIKATRNSSLIGICDLTIPSNILSKRENIFDKSCSITMTDSVKRVLFGNTSPSNYLKINLHITLQYKEKEKNINKTYEKKEKEKEKDHRHYLSNSGKKMKSYERSESFGKGGEHPKEPVPSNTFSQRNFGVTKKNQNIKKQRSNSKPSSNIKSSQTMKPKTQIFNNNNKLKEVQKEILEDEQIAEDKKAKNKNDSFIDEELNKEVKEIDPEFTNFMKEFSNKNPLDKLNSFNDSNEMMEYTKNIIDQLLDYQIKYYEMLNKTIETKNKFK